MAGRTKELTPCGCGTRLPYVHGLTPGTIRGSGPTGRISLGFGDNATSETTTTVPPPPPLCSRLQPGRHRTRSHFMSSGWPGVSAGMTRLGAPWKASSSSRLDRTR